MTTTEQLSSSPIVTGRVSRPRVPDGRVRVGGFGGADGLAAYRRGEGVTHLVDATHPFAAGITANAARVAADACVPRLVLHRPAWQTDPSWDATEDIQGAADLALLG